MTHLASMGLRNWTRFRGDHEIHLQPGAYALTAQWEGEEDRSNWAGKSAFLAAIAYGLTGAVALANETLDSLVTHGEDEAVVELLLADQDYEIVVRRVIRRGKGATLTVMPSREWWAVNPPAPGQEAGPATGAAAQALLDDVFVGFSKADFLAGPFGRQKELDALVRARPAELAETVGAWLELGPLREGQAECRERALAARKARDRLQAQLEAAQAGLGALGTEEGLRAELAEAQAAVAAAEQVVAELQPQIEEALVARRQAEQAARLENELAVLEKRGRALRAEQAALAEAPAESALGAATEAVEEATRVHGAAQGSLRAAQALCTQGFDGTCPVNGRACPVQDEINADADKAREQLVGAQAAERTARGSLVVVRQHAEALGGLAARHVHVEAELERARERYEAVQADLEQIPEEVDGRAILGLQQQLQGAQARRDEGLQQAAVAEGALGSLALRREEVERLQGEFTAAAAQVRVAARGAAIFQAAQRVVAEQELAEIEGLACSGLAGAGIPLSVAVRWEREARGLAAECPACGQAYPRSQKVKQCDGCGAERGPRYEERLGVHPSERSGAADDLAGALLQSAAAAWLRGKRGAAWSCMVLDEPGASSDPVNARALAAALLRLLVGPAFGFDQAIVSSHSREVREMFPHAITVVAGPTGSRLEVT